MLKHRIHFGFYSINTLNTYTFQDFINIICQSHNSNALYKKPIMKIFLKKGSDHVMDFKNLSFQQQQFTDDQSFIENNVKKESQTLEKLIIMEANLSRMEIFQTLQTQAEIQSTLVRLGP